MSLAGPAQVVVGSDMNQGRVTVNGLRQPYVLGGGARFGLVGPGPAFIVVTGIERGLPTGSTFADGFIENRSTGGESRGEWTRRRSPRASPWAKTA